MKMLKISGQQDLMNIDTESSLLREIKDILEELRMTELVLKDQCKVIEKLISQLPEAARRLHAYTIRIHLCCGM